MSEERKTKKDYMVDVELTVKISMMVTDEDSFQASKNAVRFLLGEVKPVTSFSLDSTTDRLQVSDIKVNGCTEMKPIDN